METEREQKKERERESERQMANIKGKWQLAGPESESANRSHRESSRDTSRRVTSRLSGWRHGGSTARPTQMLKLELKANTRWPGVERGRGKVASSD